MSSTELAQPEVVVDEQTPEPQAPAMPDGVSCDDEATPPQALANGEQRQPTPGQRLRAERECRGLSIAEVASQLKLAPRQVDALERDDHGALPGGLFVRGFLRNYARLLELDPQPMVAALSPAGEPPLEAVAPPARAAAVAGPPPSLAIALRAAGRGNRPVLVWMAAAAALAIAAALAVGLRETAPPASPGQQPAGVAADGQARPAAPALASDPPGAGVAISLADIGAEGAQLQFRFARDAWVEIRDGEGRVIFSQLNPAGATREIRGRPPLQLVVGNASGVELSYRGTPVDLSPYTRTDVARLTLE